MDDRSAVESRSTASRGENGRPVAGEPVKGTIQTACRIRAGAPRESCQAKKAAGQERGARMGTVRCTPRRAPPGRPAPPATWPNLGEAAAGSPALGGNGGNGGNGKLAPEDLLRRPPPVETGCLDATLQLFLRLDRLRRGRRGLDTTGTWRRAGTLSVTAVRRLPRLTSRCFGRLGLIPRHGARSRP